MQPSIPTVIAVLLPLLATSISSWLNDDQFKPGINALIAGAFILFTAIVCELLSAGIPVSWALRLAGVLIYVGVLMNGDLAVLYQYLVAKPSPVSKALGMSSTPVPPTPPASAPKPIILPTPAAPPAQPTTPEQVA